MSRIVLGVYAHVDGGKTTLSEAVLHKSGALRNPGRVDHEDSFLDYQDYERQKGITVYAKEARFSYGGKDFVYVDTPGHLDFIGEVNRSFEILDAAILIVDASSMIPGDTIHRFRHLSSLHIPLFLFVNKMDLTVRSKEEILEEIHSVLSDRCIPYEDCEEAAAAEKEELIDFYLNEGHLPKEAVQEALREGDIIPVFFGSALKEEGIEELLDYISSYCEAEDTSDKPFKAYIYKIDDYAHIKVLQGILHNKDSFSGYKINEVSLLNGNRAESVQEVKGSDICAVKGLSGLQAGTFLPSLFHEDSLSLQTLTYTVLSDLDDSELYRRISLLNEEFPELGIALKDRVTMELTGDLQMDFLKRLVKDRYDLDISFSAPLISYRETIEEEVYGIGHYEPLRHYAEVLVRMRPSDSFHVKASRDHAILLDYLNTYRPTGILTNSPLDKMEIEILEVRTHLKHTEGGDIVQALNRAIRQGLTKVKSHLLEPFYLVSFRGKDLILTRLLSECANRRYLYDVEEDGVLVTLPKKDFNFFIVSCKQRFKDEFTYQIEGSLYERCLNEEEVISSFAYDYEGDTLHPCGSIFTRNGAGTYFPPEEVEEVMHIDLSTYIKNYTAPVRHDPRRIDEEELKRVWNSLYKPRPRYIERKKEEEDLHPVDLTPGKELLYLIDGYNLLHAMEDVPLDDLMMAREKVIDMVCDFAGYVAANCVLVFDAYKKENSPVNISERDNITLVYTRTRQTADMYIEQKSKELAKDYRVLVVTSDRLEQISVFSSDAIRISSREFIARYQNMRKNMSHKEKAPYRPLEKLKELLEEE